MPPYAGQPYFVSEYGGIWWNPGQQDDEGLGLWRDGRPAPLGGRVHRALPRADRDPAQPPRICAFCYTQLYDIEQEVNGLYYL